MVIFYSYVSLPEGSFCDLARLDSCLDTVDSWGKESSAFSSPSALCSWVSRWSFWMGIRLPLSSFVHEHGSIAPPEKSLASFGICFLTNSPEILCVLKPMYSLILMLTWPTDASKHDESPQKSSASPAREVEKNNTTGAPIMGQKVPLGLLRMKRPNANGLLMSWQIHPDIRAWQLGVLRHFRSKLHLSVGPGVLVGGEWPQVSTLFCDR